MFFLRWVGKLSEPDRVVVYDETEFWSGAHLGPLGFIVQTVYRVACVLAVLAAAGGLYFAGWRLIGG